MTYSEHYNFALPADADGYDISPLSENFETLDGILQGAELGIGQINEKIGTPAESGQTIFSLLGSKAAAGLTAIKSIQRIGSGNLQQKKEISVAINPVDPTNCLCILERLSNDTDILLSVAYTLGTDSVTFTTKGLNHEFIVGLWIIEFM